MKTFVLQKQGLRFFEVGVPVMSTKKNYKKEIINMIDTFKVIPSNELLWGIVIEITILMSNYLDCCFNSLSF